MPELGDGVIDRGEVPDRRERRLRRDPAGDPHGAVPGRAARTVGNRDEGGPQRLKPPDREPQLLLIGICLRRHELERERPASSGQ